MLSTGAGLDGHVKAELDDLKTKIEEAGMTEEAKDKALQELARLEAMPRSRRRREARAKRDASFCQLEWKKRV